LAFPGATSTDLFEGYDEDAPVPESRRGDVVVWDNRKPHESEEAVEAAGAPVAPLPPYSPDLTPIEEMASKFLGRCGRRRRGRRRRSMRRSPRPCTT
jgi:transposase